MPDVTVVIPVYNRAIAGASIDSALAQTGVEFEVIVIDDGSDAEDAASLRSYERGRKLRLERIEHSGPAAARNAGVALAHAPLIAFLDSDDMWAREKLAKQLRFMREHPQFRISQCQEYWFRQGARVNPGMRHRKREGDIFANSLRTCLISPSAVIMERTLFDEAGGFDPDFGAAEDYDLWLRILVRHEPGLLDEYLVTRRGHGEQLSATMPAIDRFRILALAKLLRDNELSSSRRASVADALIEKCLVYGNGLRRRGNHDAANFHAELARRADSKWRHAITPELDCAIGQIRRYLRATEVR